MPRKKDTRRLYRVSIPVNSDELKALRNLAKAQRLPLAVYIRMMLLATTEGSTDGTF
jgi:hypothetical protein